MVDRLYIAPMHSHPHTHNSNNYQLTQKAILLPILLSVVLVVLKGFAWHETESISLLSSFLDSGMDILVSSMNLAAVIYAAKPADDDHRHGHTAIEDIVGLVQASFIAASGMFLIYESVHRFIQPEEVQNPDLGMGVMAVSIAAPLVVVAYQRVVMRQSKSIVLAADSLHYLSDVLMNLTILASIFIASQPGWGIVDPVLATLIAGYILYSARTIGMRAFNHIMDKEAPEEEFNQIVAIIKAQEGVLGCHKLKTRKSGSKIFIQLHIEVDGDLTVRAAHDIADALESKLEKAFDEAEVIVHIDPKED